MWRGAKRRGTARREAMINLLPFKLYGAEATVGSAFFWTEATNADTGSRGVEYIFKHLFGDGVIHDHKINIRLVPCVHDGKGAPDALS